MTRTIRAVRGFAHDHGTARPGDVLTVPERFAASVVANGKAVYYTPPPEPVQHDPKSGASESVEPKAKSEKKPSK